MYTVSMHTKRDLEFDITAPWWENYYMDFDGNLRLFPAVK